MRCNALRPERGGADDLRSQWRRRSIMTMGRGEAHHKAVSAVAVLRGGLLNLRLAILAAGLHPTCGRHPPATGPARRGGGALNDTITLYGRPRKSRTRCRRWNVGAALGEAGGEGCRGKEHCRSKCEGSEFHGHFHHGFALDLTLASGKPSSTSPAQRCLHLRHRSRQGHHPPTVWCRSVLSPPWRSRAIRRSSASRCSLSRP